jgi:predicted flap endonuclease-1-like 5' DNA nuclease
MNPIFMFVLGLLIGWLIEWVIDYLYWRRRYGEKEVVNVREPVVINKTESFRVPESVAAAPPTPDDLKVIKGIGTVIERKLNDAGIQTFEQLGNLTPAQLRRILGNSIERLANEESLLQQARDLARRNR